MACFAGRAALGQLASLGSTTLEAIECCCASRDLLAYRSATPTCWDWRCGFRSTGVATESAAGHHGRWRFEPLRPTAGPPSRSGLQLRHPVPSTDGSTPAGRATDGRRRLPVRARLCAPEGSVVVLRLAADRASIRPRPRHPSVLRSGAQCRARSGKLRLGRPAEAVRLRRLPTSSRRCSQVTPAWVGV